MHRVETRQTYASLRRLNATMAVAHLVSAAAMLLLSNSFSLPVSTTFLTTQPGGPLDPARLEGQFSVRLGPALAAFLLISAVFHAIIASPWGFPRYVRELEARQNRFRWVEYSFSASLMIILIAMITGISDVAALIAIGGVNAAMILFGWLMETTSDPGERADWTPFWFGCIAGSMPWIAIAVYLIGPGSAVPGFVYAIFVSIFLLFNCFALNQWLQYREIGPWRNYLFGERTYIVLSLGAKSALAWQVFANTLV